MVLSGMQITFFGWIVSTHSTPSTMCSGSSGLLSIVFNFNKILPYCDGIVICESWSSLSADEKFENWLLISRSTFWIRNRSTDSSWTHSWILLAPLSNLRTTANIGPSFSLSWISNKFELYEVRLKESILIKVLRCFKWMYIETVCVPYWKHYPYQIPP